MTYTETLLGQLKAEFPQYGFHLGTPPDSTTYILTLWELEAVGLHLVDTGVRLTPEFLDVVASYNAVDAAAEMDTLIRERVRETIQRWEDLA